MESCANSNTDEMLFYVVYLYKSKDVINAQIFCARLDKETVLYFLLKGLFCVGYFLL